MGVTGIILAGGQSRRMGTDKALLSLGSQTLVARTVSRLRPFCERILVVSDPRSPLPEVAGCTMVTDETPGLGPLGGLTSALTASEGELHLALACDLPLVRPEVLSLLIAESGEADVVIPRAGGRLHPLLAVYRRSCLAPARAALGTGKRRLIDFFDQVRVRVVEESRLREVDPELVSFTNVNTREDYEALLRREPPEL